MDGLYGILTAYEPRLGIDNTSKGEVAFKVTKKIENKKQKMRLTIMKNLMWKNIILLKKFDSLVNTIIGLGA